MPHNVQPLHVKSTKTLYKYSQRPSTVDVLDRIFPLIHFMVIIIMMIILYDLWAATLGWTQDGALNEVCISFLYISLRRFILFNSGTNFLLSVPFSDMNSPVAPAVIGISVR